MENRPLFVGLVRVSTEKQADSGLGLEAQLGDIERHRAKKDGELVETYTEVESGKHNSIDYRPKLRSAVEHALAIDGTLLIAKLDRLVRSTSVMEYLKQQKVKFIACDNEHANEFTIDILVAVAANEARMISRRTKDALKAYRSGRRISKRLRALHPEGVPAEIAEARAGRLGAELPECRNLTAEGRARGLARSRDARGRNADDKADKTRKIVAKILEDNPGLKMEEIARRLNLKRIKTPRGKAWEGKQVKRILDRARPG